MRSFLTALFVGVFYGGQIFAASAAPLSEAEKQEILQKLDRAPDHLVTFLQLQKDFDRQSQFIYSLIDSPSLRIRSAAVGAILSHRPDDPSVLPKVKAINREINEKARDNDGDIRLEAVECAADLGPLANLSVDQYLEICDRCLDLEAYASYVANSLSQRSRDRDKILNDLEAQLYPPKYQLTHSLITIQILARMGEPGVEILLKAANTGSHDIQGAVIAGLGRATFINQRVFDLLMNAIVGADPQRVNWAFNSLSQIADSFPIPKYILPLIRNRLPTQSSDREYQYGFNVQALNIVGAMGDDAAELIPELELYAKTSSFWSAEAKLCLLRIGIKAVPSLLRIGARGDQEFFSRTLHLELSPALISELRKTFDSGKHEDILTAVSILQYQKKLEPSDLQFFKRLLSYSDPTLSSTAATACGQHRELVDELVEMAKNKSSVSIQRTLALNSLVLIRSQLSPDLIDAGAKTKIDLTIKNSAMESDVEFKKFSLQLIEDIGTDWTMLEPLTAAIADTHPDVRELGYNLYASQFYRGVIDNSKKSLPLAPLISALTDSNQTIRENAGRFLSFNIGASGFASSKISEEWLEALPSFYKAIKESQENSIEALKVLANCDQKRLRYVYLHILSTAFVKSHSNELAVAELGYYTVLKNQAGELTQALADYSTLSPEEKRTQFENIFTDWSPRDLPAVKTLLTHLITEDSPRLITFQNRLVQKLGRDWASDPESVELLDQTWALSKNSYSQIIASAQKIIVAQGLYKVFKGLKNEDFKENLWSAIPSDLVISEDDGHFLLTQFPDSPIQKEPPHLSAALFCLANQKSVRISDQLQRLIRDQLKILIAKKYAETDPQALGKIADIQPATIEALILLSKNDLILGRPNSRELELIKEVGGISP